MNTKALKWTGIGVGAAVGTFYAVRGVLNSRSRVKQGLGRAERIADTARSILETAQKALHATRESI